MNCCHCSTRRPRPAVRGCPATRATWGDVCSLARRISGSPNEKGVPVFNLPTVRALCLALLFWPSLPRLIGQSCCDTGIPGDQQEFGGLHGTHWGGMDGIQLGGSWDSAECRQHRPRTLRPSTTCGVPTNPPSHSHHYPWRPNFFAPIPVMPTKKR